MDDLNTIYVYPDLEPGVHVTASNEVLWWLGSLGPTATMLAQLLAHSVELEPAAFEIPLLATRLGVDAKKVRHTLERLDRFNVGHFHAADVFTIRMALPLLSNSNLRRMDEAFQVTYREQFMAHQEVA
jgi:hypothetical protein